MGFNLKILSERRVDQTLYYEHAANLELRECIHDHVEDFRMIYTEEEFLKMADHWARAKKKYDEMGRPPCHSDRTDSLSTTFLGGDRLHHDRLGIEFVRGGADKDGGGDTIHVHYRNNRIHLSKRDFYRMGLAFEESIRSFNKTYRQVVSMNRGDVVLRQIAEDAYVPWLREYEQNESVPRAHADDFWDMFLESKERIRPEEIQRPDGGWLKDQPGTRPLPEDFNKRYLYTIYESIRKYGYDKGPFRHQLIRAQKNRDTGKLELTGSHRAAALKILGYDEIPVAITN